MPRSVTVVPQQQIQQQAAGLRDLSDILGKSVPGLAPTNQSLSEFGQTLRGRNPLVLIDGVPQSTNRNAGRNLRAIDPGLIERVEVLRGPTAIYGDGATGGIINMITRSGQEGPTQ
ncbi:MAG TPA: TonB-dependent receptor plug domain-containing protein [Candidatus Caenarcaniphilales bacterium]